MNEYIKACVISWMIVSFFFGVILFVSFFPDSYTANIQPLIFKEDFHSLENPTCFFCGMTRAFFEISDFNFQKAAQLNRYSIGLYLFFSFNFMALCFMGIKKLISIRHKS